MNNNKPKPTPAKKKSIPPTKPLTPAKKARGGKKRYTKKAQGGHVALRHPTKTPRRRKNVVERVILDVLKTFGPLSMDDLKTEVGKHKHYQDKKKPLPEAIELRTDMLSQAGLVAIMGAKEEEEAPPTTPSGKHEVITADSVKEKEDQAVQEDRAWAGKIRKSILTLLFLNHARSGMSVSSNTLFNEVVQACKDVRVDPPGTRRFDQIVRDMIDSGEVLEVGARRTLGSAKIELLLNPGPNATHDKTWGSPNLDKERFWAHWTRKIILDDFDKHGGAIFSGALLCHVGEYCQEHKVDVLSREDFCRIVQGMIDDGEVSIDDPSLAFGIRLRPGPKLKTRGSKMTTRLQRTIDRERYDLKKAIDEGKQEHLAAARLRTRDAITPDVVVQTLSPVSDALGDLLAFPNEWPQEATLSLDFVLPSGLEVAFDKFFGEKHIYTLRLLLVRPVIVGRIVEDVLLECRSESPLGCAQHFLAHVERFVHYGAHNAPGKRPKHLTDALVELKADVLGACAEASKVLQGAVLDNALRFFR